MDYSRAIADSAAKRLQAAGGDALTLADLLGMQGKAPRGAGTPQQGSTDVDRIGVWHKQKDANPPCYVRSAKSESGRLAHTRWADVERIPPKGTRRRVVLIGESVARGYFYDPTYTPAKVLEALLAPRLPNGAEVIDLAVNDLSSAELFELASKAPALQPDALVIFAGNNWAPAALRTTAANSDARQEAAAALRLGGVPALKRLLEDRFIRLLLDRLRMLPRLMQAIGVPVVLIVPEFNLADWRGHASNNSPWLPGDANRNWWEHHLRALRALEHGDAASALAEAEKMLSLDGGVTHNGLEIKASALASAGRYDEARAMLEHARDARIWDVANLSPRCYASIQDGLRRAASEHVRVVDLPAVFASLNSGGLPDRSLFMDYCHLNAPSIAVAMACVARALVPDIDLPPLETIRNDRALLPTPDVDGTAHLLAAIHNAHWGQDTDIIEHHLAIAAAAPEALDVMRGLLDMQGRRAPAWMTRGAAAVPEKHNLLLSRYFLRYNREHVFDERLLDATAATLEARGEPGAAARLASYRQAEWSVQARAGRVDLLAHTWTNNADQCWAKQDDGHSERQTGQMRGWYRAYAAVSRFPLISAAAAVSGIHLEITCRRPPFFVPDSEYLIQLNGMRIDTFELDATWRTYRIELPAHAIRVGVNELQFMWPLGHWQADAAIDEAAGELEVGRLAELSPAFADIWGLWLDGHASEVHRS